MYSNKNIYTGSIGVSIRLFGNRESKIMNGNVFRIFSDIIVQDIEISDDQCLIHVELWKDKLNSNVILDENILYNIENASEDTDIFLTVGRRGEDLIYKILIGEIEEFIVDLTLTEQKVILSYILFNYWKFKGID